jgi:hypothetical protein
MKKNAPKTEKKIVAPAFKSFVKLCSSEERPRGIKVVANEAGGFTFSYGPKSAPVSVIASKDELVALGLSSLGLKL